MTIETVGTDVTIVTNGTVVTDVTIATDGTVVTQNVTVVTRDYSY